MDIYDRVFVSEHQHKPFLDADKRILSLSHHQTTMASSNAKADEQGQRHMAHEIHDTISKLTDQLTAMGKSTARSGQENEEADHGMRIVTLRGENKGATMKANLEEMTDTHGALHDDERAMNAYTNSNYQAVNNSILLGGSFTAEDPGVHIVISDYVDELGDDDGDQESHEKKEKKEKEKKEKKEKKETKEKEKKEKKEKKGKKEKEKEEDKEKEKEEEEDKKEKKDEEKDKEKKEKEEGMAKGEKHSEVEDSK